MMQHYRATAFGFYNWGIYIGYSLAFAFNFILMAMGWRWTFRIAALPGFLVSVVTFLTVKEPSRVKRVCDHVMILEIRNCLSLTLND